MGLAKLHWLFPAVPTLLIVGCSPEIDRFRILPNEVCSAPTDVQLRFQGNARRVVLSAAPSTNDISEDPGEVVFVSGGGNAPFNITQTTTLRRAPTTFTLNAMVDENIKTVTETVRLADDRNVGLNADFCEGSTISTEIFSEDVSAQMLVTNAIFEGGVDVEVTSPTGATTTLGRLQRSSPALNGSRVAGTWTLRRIVAGGRCDVSSERPFASVVIRAACPPR